MLNPGNRPKKIGFRDELPFACRLFANSCAGTTVTVTPLLTRLGRTSYTIRNHVTSKSTAAELHLATVETVMVQLDDSLSKAVPVSCSEQLKSILEPQEGVGIQCPPPGEKPSECFTWTCQVRPSDCDLLGHMNNANYMTLVEDARHAAGFGSSDVRVASIEYILQAKAFETMEISMWQEGDHREPLLKVMLLICRLLMTFAASCFE